MTRDEELLLAEEEREETDQLITQINALFPDGTGHALFDEAWRRIRAERHGVPLTQCPLLRRLVRLYRSELDLD